ncbi:MAG: hypothetical protein R3D00_10545 [Bacteroidia bacterium]
MKPSVYLICNPEQALNVWSFDPKCICDSIAFEKFVNESHQPNLVIVVAGLSWEGRNYTHQYGLDLIPRLRVEMKLTCPVIVSCFSDPEELGISDKEGRYRFWKDPAISYVPLEELPSLDSSAILARAENPLEDRLLEDIVHYLYSKEGVVKEIFHWLQNRLLQHQESDPTEYVEYTFRKLMRVFSEIYQERIYKIKLDLLNMLKKPNMEFSSTASSIATALNHVLSFIQSSSEYKRVNREAEPQRTIEVIYIDDEPGLELVMSRVLSFANIKCHFFSDPDEAIRKLKEDEDNHIKVAIVDYRLNYPDGRLSRKQGYHLIEEILQLDNYISLVSLTGFDHHPFNPDVHKNRVAIFHKGYALSNQANQEQFDFITHITKEAERIENLLLGLPRLDNRKKELYKIHRNSPDYESEERRINKASEEFLAKVNDTETGNQIPGFVHQQFRGNLNAKEEEDNLQMFRCKLIGRRITLGLFLLLIEDYNINNKKGLWLTIYSLLTTGHKEEKADESGLTDLFNTHLKLSIRKDYRINSIQSKEITIEERNWLRGLRNRY